MRQPRTGPQNRKDVVTWRKVFTAKEEQQLMVYLRKRANTIAGRRIYLMCDILLNTGLRIQELAKLRLQDMPAVLGEKVIEVYMGKGKKDRMVPIGPRLVREIDKYVREIRPKTLPRHIRRSDTSRPVFYSSQQRPYLQAVKETNKKTGELKVRTRASVSLYRMIKGLGQAAGIAKAIHPHMFRHTFAVNALRSMEDGGAGIDIYALQNLMGHSSLETTAKYLHFISGHTNGMGERLDRSYDEFL